jgi:hypothetical protein
MPKALKGCFLTGRNGCHQHDTKLFTPRLHLLHLEPTFITRAEVVNLSISTKPSANGTGYAKRESVVSHKGKTQILVSKGTKA